MEKNIIQGLWIGNELTNNEILCIRSYLFNNYDFHLYCYDNIKNTPSGTTIKDANEIISEKKMFFDDANSMASFADWFRLKLLCKKGGWWVDMDTVCLKPFDIRSEYCFSSEVSANRKDIEINNTFIKVPPGSFLISAFLDKVESIISLVKIVRWGTLGIYLWRHNFHNLEILKKFMVNPIVFCPINCFDLSNLICKTSFQLTEESFAVHLWNEVWRCGCLEKNAVYHPDSIYEKLKFKYF